MNNLGKEFSVPQEKLQNGKFWIPATPKKPVFGKMQQNYKGEENWQDLLGIYSGVLQEETSNGLSVEFNQKSGVRANQGDLYNNVPQNFRANSLVPEVGSSNSSFDGALVEKLRNFNENGRSIGPYLQKVNSLDELMSMKSHPNAHSRVESIWKSYNPDGIMVQQKDSILPANQDVGDYNNLQGTPNSRLSVPYRASYNLNLPPRSEAEAEAGESSIAAIATPFQLGPVTPDQQKQLKNNQTIQIPPLLIDEISNEKTNKQDNILPPQPELVETEHILDDGEIDLNKTPPQKTPKRRKHRPKVIVEGKNSKRTPKAATPKQTTPNGNPTPKRKYVRKKGIATSTNQSTDAANDVEVEVSILESQAKSCKRALNFDLENGVEKKNKGGEFEYQEQNNGVSNLSVDLNLDPRNTETQLTELNRKEKETENLYNFIHSANKIPSQESMPIAAKDHTLNVIARYLNVRNNNNMNQSGGQSTYRQAHHSNSGGLAQLVAQAYNREQNLEGRRQAMHQARPQLLEHLWQNGSERVKTMEVNDNKIRGTSFSIPSGYTNVGACSKVIESTANNSFHAQKYGLHLNGGVPYSSSVGNSSSINPTCHRYINSNSGHKFHNQVNLHAEQLKNMTSHHLAIVPKTSTLTTLADLLPPSLREPRFTQGNDILDSPARLSAKRQIAGPTSSNKISSMDKVRRKDTKNLHYKKVKGSREDRRNIFSVDGITDRLKDLQLNNNGKEIDREERSALVPYRGESTLVPYEAFDPIKRRKPRPKVDLDPETNRLWNLLMGKEGSENAETVDNNKQKWWEEERKVFRGRVDSFIARMHLVQGDRRFSKWKGSVVDSVIGVFLTQNVSDHLSSSAFMCLAAKYPKKRETCCQNRENPSAEHEIVVTFPDGTTDNHRMINEPANDNSCVTSSELSEYGAENARTSLINNHTRRTEEGVISSQSSPESVIFQASEDIRSSSGSNSEAEDQITGTNLRTNLDPLKLFEKSEKTAVFQQYLFREMKSSSPEKRLSIGDQQSKNLAYRQNPGLLHNQTPVRSPTSSWQNLPTGQEKWKVDVLAFLGKKSASFLSSTEIEIRNGKGMQHGLNKSGQTSESSLFAAQQTGRSQFQPSTKNHQTPNKHLEQQTVSPAGSRSRNDQHCINYRQGEMQNTVQQENSFPTDSIRPVEAFNEQPTDINKVAANDRKRKAEKEKAELFNWDTLRKQVQSKAGTRGRRRNTMDSLDYEALRNADVREISDTIKERGMNNMLAERMKDFLNRLVRDHGATDLEWLRDVQPDKAKDYLLSIRGLGLKSVECVRLLTLHHLAFPVDTNVGRIAVRLGWVPLQPLPESLQLHLLELYPVLESIQKYLWPRLCMLDQETLYELHYQMITFGKVFCTKRDPNCNACPVRGECRHFASAFASARLALPGPEERRVVSSAAPTSYSKSCVFNINPMSLPPAEDNLGRGTEFRRNFESGVVINPMQLPTAEDNLGRGTQIMRNPEPIIEEPSSPESPVGGVLSERDIEDAFYEDPDEIPVIKLNIEEFTTNLQTFMQEKLDLQEGDMSKALVALSPKIASLPAPKLKHISRLRTEHQVYELPDSHPLLKGMDRREPDDPSPYLLALWTPGETADSVQPPESKCTFHEGGFCNGKTCFSCSSTREAHAQTVRGTILIPCRTAMRGSFPLNGTYFQVNEVFADHETSMNPIDVPRSLIWNLPRRTVFFGTSVTSIFKGLSTEDIQYCFWRGFVCVRGFEQKTRAPRPLRARLHLPASKIAKQKV